MGYIKSLTKNILVFSYIFLFSSTQLLGWGIDAPWNTPGSSIAILGDERSMDAPWSPQKAQGEQVATDSPPATNIVQNNLKRGSIVTIKVKGRYLTFEKAMVKQARGGSQSAIGRIILKDKLNSINQLFLVNKTNNGEFVGFRPMESSTKAANFLEFNTTTKNPFITDNAVFNDWKYFKLDPIEGKDDTYYMEYVKTDDNVIQLSNTLKAGYAATDVIGKGYAQFEIKEFTLDNPAAKTILTRFYRPDLVTIKNIGQNKYISSSHETGSIGGSSQKVITLSKPTSPLSVFKVALQERVSNKNTKVWADYKTMFEQENKWLSLISTNLLGFSPGSPRANLDLGNNNAYFNPNLPANSYSDFAFYKVYADDKYIIKNNKFGKFLRLTPQGELIADKDRATAKTDHNCLFEIKPFRLNPNLHVLYGRTEINDQFKLPKAGNGYLKFQVKAWRDLGLRLFDINKNLIGEISFNDKQVFGNIRSDAGDRDFVVIKPNLLKPNTWTPFWLLIKNNKLKIGTGSTVGQNAFNLELGPGRIKSELTNTELNKVVYFQFDGQSEYGKPDRQTIIAKVESKKPGPEIDNQIVVGAKTIKLKPGYYKIKNVETDKYVTIMDKNLDKNIYNWDMFSLRMHNKSTAPAQIFKISEMDGWHTIIGSVDATYKAPNSGIFDTGNPIAYFHKSLKTGIYRKIKIAGIGSVLGYSITSEKFPNSRYGVQGDKLVKTTKNSRFVFEPTTAPTVVIPDLKPPKPGLKVEGIDLALKKVVGGLTQVSVGGSLICGINKNGNLYNWNNFKNTWEKFSDAKYKYVSVGSDNTVLALGTNKKIYTRKDGKWEFFDNVINRRIARTPHVRLDLEPGELPSPDQTSGLPTPGSPQNIIPGSVQLRAYGQKIPMKQVSIGNREYIWALGEDGKAYKWDGLNWIDNSKGMTFSDISVGMDGTVKALDKTKKVASWTGNSWTISPFKLHQISVINKDKHWAISKEDDGSYNVYKFAESGYVLRAKNLQQMSANNEGTIFGISTISSGDNFQIYARIIKLYGKILDKLNAASERPTIKEKIETLEEAITLAVPEKIAKSLKPDELNALKLKTYTIIFNTLTKELDKAKNEKVLKELKDLVIKAAASSLIAENVKPLLTNFAQTKIIIEEKPKKEDQKVEQKKYTRRRATTPRTTRGRSTRATTQPWQRGGQQRRVIRRTAPTI